VAGPVRGGKCKISNLAWTIDAGDLATQLKLKSVGLINDLEAFAYGIDGLESKDFVTLSAGLEDAVGNRAVISARTGLGVAGLYWDGFRHHPFACEGGHCSFSPSNEMEIELLHSGWLKEQVGTAHDAPALISQLALQNKAAICEQTLSIFVICTKSTDE
jgi:glucokinase